MSIKKDKSLIEWMEDIDAEVQYRMENWQNYYSEQPDIQKVQDDIYSDSAWWDIEWKDLLEALTDIMKHKNPDGYWKAEVKNFGWRNLSGYKYFEATNGSDLLKEILPQTDCHFRIFNNGRFGIKIQNFHHDSPVGNEWYFINKINLKKYREVSGF